MSGRNSAYTMDSLKGASRHLRMLNLRLEPYRGQSPEVDDVLAHAGGALAYIMAALHQLAGVNSIPPPIPAPRPPAMTTTTQQMLDAQMQMELKMQAEWAEHYAREEENALVARPLEELRQIASVIAGDPNVDHKRLMDAVRTNLKTL